MHDSPVTFTVLCGAIGILLYIMRQAMRRLYSIAEMLVGLAAYWVAIGQSSKSGLEGAIALGTGLYIIVRGSENWVKAKDEKAKAEKEKKKRVFPQKPLPAEFWRSLISPYEIAPENPFQKLLRDAQQGKK